MDAVATEGYVSTHVHTPGGSSSSSSTLTLFSSSLSCRPHGPPLVPARGLHLRPPLVAAGLRVQRPAQGAAVAGHPLGLHGLRPSLTTQPPVCVVCSVYMEDHQMSGGCIEGRRRPTLRKQANTATGFTLLPPCLPA